MRKLLTVAVAIAMMAASALPSLGSVSLYVDSAPNALGSAKFAAWWTQAKADVVAGTFTDLRNGTYPGKPWIAPSDEIAYSTGDLGKRLNWIYWVPGATTAGLNNNFQVKWTIDWGGMAMTGDWATATFALDGPEVGWTQPASWEAYNNGVIGTFDFAWWANDDMAWPYDTKGDPYDETNQADIDALREAVFHAQTYALGQVRYRDSENDPWQYSSIQDIVGPEPAPIIVWSLLGALGIGVVWWRRKRAA